MKKFELQESQKKQTFIEGWLSDDEELCDQLIELFESNESKLLLFSLLIEIGSILSNP